VKSFRECFISTDSIEYGEHVAKFGVKFPQLRPKEISGDSSTDCEVMIHALSWMQSQGSVPDYIAHLRPTTPLRDPVLLNDFIENFVADKSEWTSARSVHKMSESAYKCLEISPSGLLTQVFSKNSALDKANRPKEEFPDTYKPNGYIDLISTAHVLRTGLLHGNMVYPLQTHEVIEIDSAFELQIANALASQDQSLYLKVF
jgi:CMP-N-acetylneuraminic acid synthetase